MGILFFLMLFVNRQELFYISSGRIDPCAALRDITGGYVYVYGYLFFMHFWTI